MHKSLMFQERECVSNGFQNLPIKEVLQSCVNNFLEVRNLAITRLGLIMAYLARMHAV